MVNQQRVLNKKLANLFRMRGMTARPDAMDALFAVLKDDEQWEETLQTLLGELQQQQRKQLRVRMRGRDPACAARTARPTAPSPDPAASQSTRATSTPPPSSRRSRRSLRGARRRAAWRWR